MLLKLAGSNLISRVSPPIPSGSTLHSVPKAANVINALTVTSMKTYNKKIEEAPAYKVLHGLVGQSGLETDFQARRSALFPLTGQEKISRNFVLSRAFLLLACASFQESQTKAEAK